MSDLDRRLLLGGLVAGGTALAAARPTWAGPAEMTMKDLKKDTDVACLYHCDFANDQRYDTMLRNINNHLSAYEFDPFKIKIVIVAHGGGIKYHLSDLAGTPWEQLPPHDPELDKRIKGLAGYGVEVYLCRITFQRSNIDLGKARKEDYVKIVPSGVATVGELQGKGFGYLKVG